MSMSLVARALGHHHLAGVLFEPTGKTTGSPTGPRTSPGANPPLLRMGRQAGGVQSEPPPKMISTKVLSTQLAQKFQSEWAPTVTRATISSMQTALSILSQPAPVSIGQGGPSAFRSRLTPITASPPPSQANSLNPSPAISPTTGDTEELSLPRYESGPGTGEMSFPTDTQIAPPKTPALPEKKRPPYPLDPITATVWKVQQELNQKYPHLADLDRSTGPRVDNSFNLKGLPEGAAGLARH